MAKLKILRMTRMLQINNSDTLNLGRDFYNQIVLDINIYLIIDILVYGMLNLRFS